MSDLAISVIWLLGLVAAGAMIWVFWWAVFGDRRRDLRRCPTCWHDLSGTPGLICGECGHEASGEAQLHRPRRRWRVAGLVLLALVTAASVIRWRAIDASWAATAPTWMLLAILPWSDGERGEVFGELAGRLNRKKLDDRQIEILFSRCMRGDGDGGPPSPSWARRYAPYLQWWRRPGFGSESQQASMEALPPTVTLRAPPVWPLDAPTCVHLQVEDWWPPGKECRVRLRTLVDGADEIVVVRGAGDRFRSPFPFLVEPPPVGAEAVEIEVIVERRPPPADSDPIAAGAPSSDESDRPWTAAHRTVVAVPVGQRRGAADALAPVDSDMMTAAISDAFSAGLNRWATGRRRFGTRFNTAALRGPEFADVAIGLRVEVLEAGSPRRVLDLWWYADPGRPGPLGWNIVQEDPGALDRLRDGDPGWTLRVTGRPELALRALGIRGFGDEPAGQRTSPPRFWAGSFERPLSIVDQPGRAPTRAWMPEREPARDAATPHAP